MSDRLVILAYLYITKIELTISFWWSMMKLDWKIRKLRFRLNLHKWFRI